MEDSYAGDSDNDHDQQANKWQTDVDSYENNFGCIS